MNIERFEASARRSDMVLYDNTLYIGGQVTANTQGDIEAENCEILGNIEAMLLSVGRQGRLCRAQPGLGRFLPRRPCADSRLHPSRTDQRGLAGGNDRGSRALMKPMARLQPNNSEASR